VVVMVEQEPTVTAIMRSLWCMPHLLVALVLMMYNMEGG
jgi:hypothetical protein